MNRTEHLLTILAEECAEISQRATKALRFGVNEVQPGQPLSNAARMREELVDLWAVVEMLADNGIPIRLSFNDRDAIEAKKQKVEKFLCYSIECGTMETTE